MIILNIGVFAIVILASFGAGFCVGKKHRK